MAQFKYEARDAESGQRTSGVLDGPSEKKVVEQLRAQGLTPISVEQKAVANVAFSRRIATKDRVLFSRQLATLLNAGMPILQSLRAVEEQTSNQKMRAIVQAVIQDVEIGRTLSEAMSKHPQAFNEVFQALIAAGEVSGTLNKTLDRIAFQQEKDAEIMSKVRGAFIYPIIVLLVMFAVVLFMTLVVLPQVEELYKSLGGANLPLPTQIMIWFSDLITKFWWLMIIVVVGGIFGAIKWIQTPVGKRFSDTMRLRAPLIKGIFQKVYMARFSRVSYSLVSSAVPIINVLEITSTAVNNTLISVSLKRATELVRGGQALSVALENDPNFLPLVPSMIKIGEQSGAIADMLEKLADHYEKEVDNQIKNISTIIEPALMVVLGIMAIIIVAAVLLPVYSLVNQSFV